MSNEIRLGGNSMFHVPGVVRAMTNDYQIGAREIERLNKKDEDDMDYDEFNSHKADLFEANKLQWRGIEVVSGGWGLGVDKVRQILGGECELKEDGDNLIVTFPE